MSTEKWHRQRLKGFWHYVFYKGIVWLGLVGGIIIFTFQYWQDTGFVIENMKFTTWFSDYLVRLPITIAVGFFISMLVWLEFENKYQKKE
ncbi:MAG: hypothetical protein CML20_16505 [Rheinheimera sp.]|uniref:hypothetical protein n=1 Tax=Arsukibacterium sp. UBA3155 TaxID=1946058 RepID=UPI000C8CC0F8|nr:hypothetical protein [Arsukibacterium sp. UBA3155]MAD76361.1 hypothetical protein [Rheinheimera sp.]|tara:strand:+ start:129006 stop:129275 length:270 start_codon:yes stop_codon:yes gene_type:complete